MERHVDRLVVAGCHRRRRRFRRVVGLSVCSCRRFLDGLPLVLVLCPLVVVGPPSVVCPLAVVYLRAVLCPHVVAGRLLVGIRRCFAVCSRQRRRCRYRSLDRPGLLAAGRPRWPSCRGTGSLLVCKCAFCSCLVGLVAAATSPAVADCRPG